MNYPKKVIDLSKEHLEAKNMNYLVYVILLTVGTGGILSVLLEVSGYFVNSAILATCGLLLLGTIVIVHLCLVRYVGPSDADIYLTIERTRNKLHLPSFLGILSAKDLALKVQFDYQDIRMYRVRLLIVAIIIQVAVVVFLLTASKDYASLGSGFMITGAIILSLTIRYVGEIFTSKQLELELIVIESYASSCADMPRPIAL